MTSVPGAFVQKPLAHDQTKIVTPDPHGLSDEELAEGAFIQEASDAYSMGAYVQKPLAAYDVYRPEAPETRYLQGWFYTYKDTGLWDARNFMSLAFVVEGDEYGVRLESMAIRFTPAGDYEWVLRGTSAKPVKIQGAWAFKMTDGSSYIFTTNVANLAPGTTTEVVLRIPVAKLNEITSKKPKQTDAVVNRVVGIFGFRRKEELRQTVTYDERGKVAKKTNYIRGRVVDNIPLKQVGV